MNPLHRNFPLSACALAAAALLSACGGGDATPPAVAKVTVAGDTVAPTLTITDDQGSATATGPVTFSFTFSEGIGTSFTVDDIVVTGGTKGAFTMADTTHATLVVTPTANAAGTIAVSVAALKFNDASGNGNSSTAAAQRAYNTVPAPVLATKLVSFDEATPPVLTGFGGAEDSTVVADPTNAANKVAKVVKAANAELWAGTTVSICPNQALMALPLSATNKTLSAKVWSPDAGIPVRMKIEDAADNTKTVETEATTTVAGGWQTMNFNFANPAAGTAALNLANTYNKASVFFNFGKTGAQAGGARTYYLDDLTFVGSTFTVACPSTGGGGGTATTASVTFDEATAPLLTGFGGAEDSTVVADPANAANKVAKVVKAANAELWAGTTISTLANQAISAIGFTASNTTLTARVWSPDAGIPVRLKVESATDNTKTVETEANTTAAGAWQTLSFNFANQAAGTAALNLANTYNKVSIFFNFGKTGAQAGSAKTYYVDDVTWPLPSASGSGGGTGSGGAGAGTGTALIYASNYTDVPTPWKSVEGGDAGRYIDTSVVTQDWWSGVAAADATPSFYFGYGVNVAAKPWGFGAFVKAPANGTANITGKTTLRIAVWGNDQLMNAHPTLTVILKGPAVGACTSEVKGSIAVTAPGVQVYDLALSGFTLQTACAYASAAAALAAGVTEVHIQALGANLQYTSGGDAGGNYPNGFNVGPISFR